MSLDDGQDDIFNNLEDAMVSSNQFKPSKLLGECRFPLNKTETKHIVIGHQPQDEATNSFDLTSSEVKFRTVARIVDRKTNLHIELEYGDLTQMREVLSSFFLPIQQQQQQATSYKFPLYLQSVQVAKITGDLFCISSRSSSADMLIGRTSIEQLIYLSKQLSELFDRLDSVSNTLERQVNCYILNILEKNIGKFKTIDDMVCKLDELELEPCVLHIELLLKYPEIYFNIFNNVKVL